MEHNNIEIFSDNVGLTNIKSPIFNTACKNIESQLLGGNFIDPQTVTKHFNVNPVSTPTPNPAPALVLIPAPATVPVPVQVPVIINTTHKESTTLGSEYYSIFGYKFSLLYIILMSILVLVVLYFIYKYLFSSNEAIVNYKKSTHKNKNPNGPCDENSKSSSNSNSNSNSNSKSESSSNSKNSESKDKKSVTKLNTKPVVSVA